MNFYSTNNDSYLVPLEEAVLQNLAPDRGLFMPCEIPQIASRYLRDLPSLSLHDIANIVLSAFFTKDTIAPATLEEIIHHAFTFDIPLVATEDKRWVLELFHGPTLAFKDVGARFMAQYFAYLMNKRGITLTVLVATSGDTGGAVASAFYNTPIPVYVLYPAGKVSDLQERQLTTLGGNVTAVRVDGTFDDCQALVKRAFLDATVQQKHHLTSANSINIARFLPQIVYYFYAYSQFAASHSVSDEATIIVPSGNLGNVAAGLMARNMGLRRVTFLAANNANDTLFRYLTTGSYVPKTSIETLATAMDVGDPSNFARIYSMYQGSHARMTDDLRGCTVTDEQIRSTIYDTYHRTGYLLDPHTACGYYASQTAIARDAEAIITATAHPSKFTQTIEDIFSRDAASSLELHPRLAALLDSQKEYTSIANDYDALKGVLSPS